MRLVDSSRESNPIENASVNATNSKVSWRFALLPGRFSRISKRLFFVSLVVAAIFSTEILCEKSFAASTKTQSVSAALLKQESVFIGPHELCVSQDALRSTDLNTGIITVVTAADKKAVIFNAKTKCYFQTKIDTMGMDSTVTSYTPFRFALSNRKWTKCKELVFCGKKVIVYESLADSKRTKGKGWSRTDGVDIQQARYAEAPEIRLPACLLKALEYLYIIPPPKCVPVRLVFNSVHNKANFKEVLKTISIEKISVPTTFFSVPKGYKQVFKRSQVGDYAKRDAVLESVTDLILEHH